MSLCPKICITFPTKFCNVILKKIRRKSTKRYEKTHTKCMYCYFKKDQFMPNWFSFRVNAPCLEFIVPWQQQSSVWSFHRSRELERKSFCALTSSSKNLWIQDLILKYYRVKQVVYSSSQNFVQEKVCRFIFVKICEGMFLVANRK